MPNRPQDISGGAWRVMQCLRNGDQIVENHKTGEICILGVRRIGFDSFEELKASGLIRVLRHRKGYTTYRLSDKGWCIAAGDPVAPAPAAPPPAVGAEGRGHE
jgi:hypothetical protein